MDQSLLPPFHFSNHSPIFWYAFQGFFIFFFVFTISLNFHRLFLPSLIPPKNMHSPTTLNAPNFCPPLARIQPKPRKGHLQNPFFSTADKFYSRIPSKPRKGQLQNLIFSTTQNCISRIQSKPIKGYLQNPTFSSPPAAPPFETTLTVAEKVNLLASEFKSLPEPIDRVKRLLHYATLLPPFDESDRVKENRVAGCTTTVWLRVEMGPDRLMRYRADSDSEITKGFCSCLIWVFDGAIPEEVLSTDTDDLSEMNVGKANSRGHSRVNTWHNILSTMQKRTKKFVEIKDDKDRSFMGFPSLVSSPNGSYKVLNFIHL